MIITPAFSDILKQDVERLEKAIASPYIEVRLDLFQSVLRSYEGVFPELPAHFLPLYPRKMITISGCPGQLPVQRLDVNALRTNLGRLHAILKTCSERLPAYPVHCGKAVAGCF